MATITGTPGNDTLPGTPQDDVISGLAGNDTITGGGGNDVIDGGLGDDTAINENVYFGGNDSVNLGEGWDNVVVLANNDPNGFPGFSPNPVVRLIFSTSGVGNGNSNAEADQSGMLAVQFQGEISVREVVGGPISTYDDEGITFSSNTIRFNVVPNSLLAFPTRDIFESVTLGTSSGDALVAPRTNQRAYLNGGAGNDTIVSGSGNDLIFAGTGDDIVLFNVSTDGADRIDLGDGSDIINVSAAAAGQVRLTINLAEIANGNGSDANTFSGQGLDLAVRLQAEGTNDTLVSDVTRVDDEGITFVSSTPGLTFDLRDLVSGAQAGDRFQVVTFGTVSSDTLTATRAALPTYLNAGSGDDAITGGTADDALVGGAGNDTLAGGLGNDRLFGGTGADTVIFDVTGDGADSVDLGDGADVVNVSAAPAGQVRVTFTSAEVGNGSATDGNSMANQDGGLAVRLQAEGAGDILVGGLSRFDDEGTTFVSATAGLAFDVRDLVSGTQRGNAFEVVTLGTAGADSLAAISASQAHYFNAGAGNDTVVGGSANDVLVGGSGSDALTGGAGNDTILGAAADDTAAFNVSTDGADNVDLGEGADIVSLSASAGGQVRLTFTSSEVGNGSASDAGTMANQDGGLAVRVQAEGANDVLMGDVSRFDDEGITFVSATGGLTFDVRDLVAGTPRGEIFQAATLGTAGNDTLTAIEDFRRSYVNAGAGNDIVTGGVSSDFLVGGTGNDILDGGRGNDSFVGGAGDDRILGGAGTDRVIFTFALGAAVVGANAAGDITITGPEGADIFRGIEQFQFTDRTIDNADGSPLVDDLFYLGRNPDVAAAGQDPEAHYAAYGAVEGRDPNAFFSTSGYLAANRDVARSGINPLDHYDQFGFTEGRDPGALFDTEFYLVTNPDVRAASVNPLEHYLQFGQAEGRAITSAIGRSADIVAGFDAQYYLLSNPDVARAAATTADSFAYARLHFDEFGAREGRNPNSVFDTSGYLLAYSDVAQAGINPLDHYEQFGFREGRDPSTRFDSSAYLANYLDVAAEGIDPMQHYLQFGIYEGRPTFGDASFGSGTIG